MVIFFGGTDLAKKDQQMVDEQVPGSFILHWRKLLPTGYITIGMAN